MYTSFKGDDASLILLTLKESTQRSNVFCSYGLFFNLDEYEPMNLSVLSYVAMNVTFVWSWPFES
jgi:hypothetical protein